MVDVARKYYPFDRNLAFSDGVTLTATGNIQFAAADVIIDTLGGRMDGVLVINVSAIDVSSGNEAYQIILQGSNDSGFASGIENLAQTDMGHASVRLGGASASSIVGVHEMPFTNNRAGVEYRYLRVRVVAAGTTPSITFQQVHIANISIL